MNRSSPRARLPRARVAASTLIALLIAGCDAGRTPEAAIDGTPVALLEYVAVAPTAWTARQPASSMRLAEYDTPPVPGEEPGQVVVYFFGAGQGGSVEANVERWRGQFSNEDGSQPEPAITRVSDGAFPTTIVELRGRYARNIGLGGGATEPRPNQILLAAVIETPQGNLYVQLHGPAASVNAARDSFSAFVSSIRPHATAS